MTTKSNVTRWSRRALTAYVARNEAHILTMLSTTQAAANAAAIDWRLLSRTGR